MKGILYTLFCCFYFCSTATSQERLTPNRTADFKSADRFMTTNIDKLVGTIDVDPMFINGTDCFWYKYKTSEGVNYYYVNPAKRKVEKLFDNAELVSRMSRIAPVSYMEKDIAVRPVFSHDGKSFTITVDSVSLLCTLKGRVWKEIPAEKKKTTRAAIKSRELMMYSYSKDSLCVVYTLRHNIWMKKLHGTDSVAVQMTKDGAKLYSYSDDEKGAGESVFSSKSRWLGTSHKLYALREDNRKLYMLPVVDNIAPRPKVSEYYYSFPGDKDVVQYDLIIIDADKKSTMKIDIAKWKDQKVKILETSKDGKKLYFERKRRTCDEIEVCVVDTDTGKVTPLFGEISKPYLNEQQHSFSVLNDGEEMLWWSERSGWGHYYLYDKNGTLKRQLTSGEWIASEIMKIDTVGRKLYVVGFGREKGINPYYRMLYRVDMDGRQPIEKLTSEDATHHTVVSSSCSYIIDNYSRVNSTPKSVLRDNHGRVICELGTTDLKRLYETGWKVPEPFTVKAADGVTDLYGVMWKPYNFDSTKRYPIISFVYPGPQVEGVPLKFSPSASNCQSLAQVGFIVICMGHRGGSPVRNKAYHTFGYNNLRDYPLADDKYGIEQLADRYRYIDIDRVGIYGHSGGGFMSTAALCTYPDFYKAAVSSSGNHNNNIYNIWWVESHNGVKETVKNGVSKFESKVLSNLDLAKNLKGHLLLITGDSDENVHPAHTFQMSNALYKAGKNFELCVFPSQHHMYQGEYDLIYSRKLWFHFAKYLLGDNSSDSFYEMEQYKQ